ncbi:prealbumin-like fold domain-containing protein [Deinococcus malanensis]|uniref:prealbumin-like fold domain-containing protein n=1 Tax=Deinococcus malanensis TaxID=1706855 RepID=UPI00166CE4AA|nr:hypothetical protein [Deinococcus malanensis]
MNFTLEGCRNDGSPVITLPNSSGDFICPDSAYTSGNLGKGWNELDLVPHRLTMSVGNQANATTSFSVVLAADHKTSGKTGYDVVTVPVINAAKSDPSCQIDVDIQRVGGSVTGGADQVVYTIMNVTLDKGKPCVVDYTLRLALGAAQYPGSSLQAYMFEKTDFSTGKRTIPLPVREIKPQELSKTMTASQGRDQVWDVRKQPTPATLNFGDVCAPGAVSDLGVQIRVAWEIKTVVPGNVTLLTNVYATNPAARTITVNVTDRMYQGSDQSTLIDTRSSGPVNVPANTANVLVLTHSYSLATTSDLANTVFNDVATATYTDLVTGVAVPGTTEARAQATVTTGTTTNATADVADSESITGTGLTFAVATPSIGAFSGYTAGTFVTGPVNWAVTGQTAAGSVTFDKTVRLDTKRVTSGVLSDAATLTGSDGASATASAAVNISSSASVSLTINKTIPSAQSTDQTFSFTVKNGAGASVGTPSITIPAGQTRGNVVVGNLEPGTYSAEETPAAGWAAVAAQQAGINLPDCAGAVTFNNNRLPKLTVIKVVQNDFGGTKTVSDFPLNVSGAAVESGVPGTYAPGQYKVGEGTLPPGYTMDSITGDCDATGNVTLDLNDNKTCTIVNSDSPGTIVVIKNALPANGSFAFTTTGTNYSGFTLQGATANGANVNTQTGLAAGTYTVRESTQLGWTLTGIGGSADPNTPYACLSTGSSTGLGDLATQTATINLKMGETVTCMFENTGRGVTRTQGFWQTHPQLALVAWTGGSAFGNTFPGVTSVLGDTTLCGKVINAGSLGTPGSSDLMGGFWSDISKTTSGAKRSALDQARMQLLQQMIAAELNASAFGSVPAGGMTMFLTWEAAFCGTNANAIKDAQRQAANFNETGDSGTFTPGTSADSRFARSIANSVRWNTLP